MNNSMLKVSEAATIALHTVSLLAGHPGRKFSNTQIAEHLHCSNNTLSKVLQRLVKTGIVRSVRGPGGGSELDVDPTETSILDVYEAVDGPLCTNQCLLGGNDCRSSNCILGELVRDIHQRIREAFTETTLDKLAKSMKIGDA